MPPFSDEIDAFDARTLPTVDSAGGPQMLLDCGRQQNRDAFVVQSETPTHRATLPSPTRLIPVRAILIVYTGGAENRA